MLWKLALCVPFCLAANLTDYRTLRIPNKLVVYTALAGLALQLLLNGPAGIGQWLAGMLPAFILLPFFALRMMGAGDIKLLAALGSVLGAQSAVVLLFASLLASGVIGAVVLLARGEFGVRFRVLGRYFKSCFMARTVLPYADEDRATGSSGKFAFSYGITLGLLLVACYYLLYRS